MNNNFVFKNYAIWYQRSTQFCVHTKHSFVSIKDIFVVVISTFLSLKTRREGTMERDTCVRRK